MPILYGSNTKKKATAAPSSDLKNPYTLEQLSKDIYKGNVKTQEQLDTKLQAQGYQGNTEQNRVTVSSSAYRAGKAPATAPTKTSRYGGTGVNSQSKAPNSSGGRYGSAGTNVLGTSYDAAGNSVMGTMGGRNIMGGRATVDRTPAIPSNPLDAYMSMLSPQSVVDRQRQARRDLENERQGQLDAIRQKYKAQVATEQQAGAEDLARMRSMNLRAGLGGSDFGAANKIGVRDRTNANVRAIEANADIEIGNAINAIETAAQTRFTNEQNALSQGFQNLYTAQTYSDTKAKEAKTEIMDSLKVLAQADPTLDMAKLQKKDPQLYESIKQGLGKTDFEVDALFKQNNGQTSEYAWRGDNLVVISKDAMGNPIGTKTYKAEELGIPKNVEFQTMTNEVTGDVYWYDPNDTSDGGAPKLRMIGKFANTLADVAAAKAAENASTGMSEKDRTIFNSIVDKYAKSPLIAAADRTVVLKSTIDQVKNDPSNGALQLNLAYAYIQALDTYQSAVREGELSLVNSIDSKVGQLEGEIQKITNGQIVRPDVAKQLAEAADSIVNTINQGAKNAETRYRSQAKVNGIEDAWDEFIGGYTQQYNQQDIQSTIDSLIQQYPNATEEEILQLMDESGFSPVGNTTASTVNIPKSSRLAFVNNNPGNLKFVGQAGAVKGEGGFAKFSSPEAGLAALKRQIQLDSTRGLTLEGFIRKYAPPSENDTSLYLSQVTQMTGAKPSTKLSQIDIDTLTRAVAKKESSTNFA